MLQRLSYEMPFRALNYLGTLEASDYATIRCIQVCFLDIPRSLAYYFYNLLGSVEFILETRPETHLNCLPKARLHIGVRGQLLKCRKIRLLLLGGRVRRTLVDDLLDGLNGSLVPT
jgi:hypothetical protein